MKKRIAAMLLAVIMLMSILAACGGNTAAPAPTQPAPTQPAPTQPAPTEPAPVEPANNGDALMPMYIVIACTLAACIAIFVVPGKKD